MRLKYTGLLAAACFLVTGLTSCKKYLDVNSSEAAPQDPSVSSVFPTQLGAIPRGLQYDSRYIGKYIQNFGAASSMLTWDNMGYDASSDNGGDIWRMTYYGLGKNLNFIINKGIANGQYDYVGAAYALKALSFQYVADECGPVIFTEAFPADENVVTFHYDDQPVVYAGVDSLCRVALSYLSRTDNNTNMKPLSAGDYSYGGNTTLWKKMVYGLMARNFHRTTNKSDYQADSVIKYCDLAMQTVAEDFVIPFDAAKNDDANFAGVARSNYTLFRQSAYIVSLLDGTILSGQKSMANRDPRIRHMLTYSLDTSGTGNGGYRGVAAGVADPNYTLSNTNAKAIPFLWSDTISGSAASVLISRIAAAQGKYLFSNKAVLPVITSAEIQFMKAEAAFLKGDQVTAFNAYRNGISLHFDFINYTGWPKGNTPLYSTTGITLTERANYLASTNVKQTPSALTIGDIMLQKYIALWGWGFFETWVDMRRYHYIDLDRDLASTNVQVYKNFTLPTLASTNVGRPAYRVRPRYNSEYVWNLDELQRWGGANTNYHTYECWFSQQ
ncbi:MAG: SusD/RagB family nutrient-binding outer membrane lipoprotein [Filimonas sp.]|nr:SusD/RagB family nutrient-binding outer membrane lipoprotein [Filimonas sp.]